MNPSIYPFLVPITAILAFAFVSYIKHTSARPEKAPSFDPEFRAALTRAEAHATRLEERIDHLERILDEDAPGWRTRSSR